MKIEIGKEYTTRNGAYKARIISVIGKFDRNRPIVGELYEIEKKRKIPSYGFERYEHWSKSGRYLGEADSEFDLINSDQSQTAFTFMESK